MPTHKFYNCKVTLDNGATKFLDANWLHNNNHDNWKEWDCFAGVDRIFISADGTVYSGECCNDILGNIDAGWNLLENPTVCKRNRCTGCTDDLIVTKENKHVV